MTFEDKQEAWAQCKDRAITVCFSDCYTKDQVFIKDLFRWDKIRWLVAMDELYDEETP